METDDYVLAFKNLIRNLSKIGKVAVLIDEYDKPIIEYVESPYPPLVKGVAFRRNDGGFFFTQHQTNPSVTSCHLPLLKGDFYNFHFVRVLPFPKRELLKISIQYQ